VKKGFYFHPKKRVVYRSYGFVLNSVFALNELSLCQESVVKQQVFYLADYTPIEIKKWADMIAKGFNVNSPIEIPLPLLKIAAALGDLLKFANFPNPPLTSFRLNNMLTDAIYDLSNLQDAVGTLPYSIEEGVDITVDWMLSGK